VVVEGAVHREVSGTVWRARQVGASIELDVDGDPERALADLRARVAEGLPWEPVADLAAQEPRVADLVGRHPGYRPPITPSPFEAIVTAISAQQVNLRWATTTRTRLVERYGQRHSIGGVDVWAFPRPETLAAADPAEIRAMQWTTRKADYVVGVARAVTEGLLDGLHDLGNEGVVARLMSVRGLGRWTAEQVLARSLARPDAVAAGDLGVRKAVSHLWHRGDELLDEATVRDTAAAWGDAANWVTHLLLEDLAEGLASTP
jgi:DNA-3-methyladenine glycosylase II